jgi:glycosyltransferase involved in cell wall biosynthesis
MSVRTTVVVPAYRAWNTLPATLDALRPQVDRPDRELVLVESSGTVGRASIERRWPWARVLALPDRVLPGRARNLGVEAAEGELIAFIDADAVPDHDWLDALERALEPGADGVAGAILNGAPASRIATADYLLEFSDWLPGQRLPLLHGATCNLLLRRRVLADGGFPADLWPGEDTMVTFDLGVRRRLVFAGDARVRHAGRSTLRDYVVHQRELGSAFAYICDRLEFPRRRFARTRYGPLLPALRLVAVARRVQGNPAALRAAIAVTPLLVLGAVAWTGGVLRGRRASVARDGFHFRMAEPSGRNASLEEADGA